MSSAAWMAPRHPATRSQRALRLSQILRSQPEQAAASVPRSPLVACRAVTHDFPSQRNESAARTRPPYHRARSHALFQVQQRLTDAGTSQQVDTPERRDPGGSLRGLHQHPLVPRFCRRTASPREASEPSVIRHFVAAAHPRDDEVGNGLLAGPEDNDPLAVVNDPCMAGRDERLVPALGDPARQGGRRPEDEDVQPSVGDSCWSSAARPGADLGFPPGTKGARYRTWAPILLS